MCLSGYTDTNWHTISVISHTHTNLLMEVVHCLGLSNGCRSHPMSRKKCQADVNIILLLDQPSAPAPISIPHLLHIHPRMLPSDDLKVIFPSHMSGPSKSNLLKQPEALKFVTESKQNQGCKIVLWERSSIPVLDLSLVETNLQLGN